MYRKMTRFARGRTWNFSIRPCEVHVEGSAGASPARRRGSSSEASAIDPSPIEAWPRKDRRVSGEIGGWSAVIGSVPRNALVEVQDRPRDRGQSRALSRSSRPLAGGRTFAPVASEKPGEDAFLLE